MSAIAQYLQGIGKNVSGSDRYFHPDEYNKTKEQLENEGIIVFPSSKTLQSIQNKGVQKKFYFENDIPKIIDRRDTSLFCVVMFTVALVFVDSGNGYKMETIANRVWNKDDIVLDKCFHGYRGVQVKGPSNDG